MQCNNFISIIYDKIKQLSFKEIHQYFIVAALKNRTPRPLPDFHRNKLSKITFSLVELKKNKISNVDNSKEILSEIEKSLTRKLPVIVGMKNNFFLGNYHDNGVNILLTDKNNAHNFSDLDHSVVIVSKYSYEEEDYYVIQNSWSYRWGHKGMALMRKKDLLKDGNSFMYFSE